VTSLPPPRGGLVRWRYHFTDFRSGRLLATLPMTGVSLSEVLNGAAEGSGIVPLASDAVRRRDPLGSTVPRRTCVWAQRLTLSPDTGLVIEDALPWAGLVRSRERTRSGRAAKLGLLTWPSYWQARTVADHTWTQADKFAIMRSLAADGATQPVHAVLPAVPPHLAALGTDTALSGVLADRTYAAVALKPALEAMTELGASGAGFHWRMRGEQATAGDLNTFRVRLDLGYPRLGRTAPPDVRWSTRQADSRSRWGYVADYSLTEPGTAANEMTALGSGQPPDQLRSVARDADELAAGIPLYQGSLASSDTTELVTQAAIDARAAGGLAASLAARVIVSGVKVRGDLPPVLTSYVVGDDATLRIEDEVTGQLLTVTGQIIGRTIQPAGQGRTETVALDVAGTVIA
jgi:hypothetical protein